VLPLVVRDADGASSLFRARSKTKLVSVDSPDLRNRDGQCALKLQSRLIERENGRRGQRHRNAVGDFEQIAPELRRVVGGAAGGQQDEARPVAFEQIPQLLDGLAFGLERPLENRRLARGSRPASWTSRFEDSRRLPLGPAELATGARRNSLRFV